MSKRTLSAPVAIVGGGPVGMVLAMQLDAWGVRCILVNDGKSVRWHPKGNTHNARTMEHYRRLGIAEPIRHLGLPADWPTDILYHTKLNSHLLARLRMPSTAQKRAAVAAADPTDQVPEPIHRANQMYVETFLFDHLSTRPHVQRLFGWRCTGFSDTGDDVRAEIEQTDGGEAATIRCSWLVGCDGGGSEIRRRLGIRFAGETGLDQAFFGRDMLSTHVRIPALHERIMRRRGWQYWAVSEDARAALFVLDGKDEFVMLGRLRAGEQPDDRALAQLIQRAVGEPVDVDIVGNRGWTGGQALVADRFRRGRVVLAGDAVHLFTPTGGFGMNTGIDDTANLAWKLAADVQGWAGRHLMSSYEAERRPVALRNTKAAHDLARNIGQVPVTADMESDRPAAIAARQAAGSMLAGFGEEFASLGIQLGARYDGSPIIVGDGIAPPPDDPAVYRPSGVPGGRAPHAWLDGARRADRASLYDRLGLGFTILCLGGTGRSAAPLVRTAADRNVPLAVVEVDADAVRDLYGRDLVLVRPDQHVAWRGNRLPDDPGALIGTIVGACGESGNE